MRTTNPEATTTRLVTAAACLLMALTPAADAADTALLRLQRSSAGDRNAVIAAGVVLVAETDDALLAVGPRSAVENAAAAAGLDAEVVASDPEAFEFALAGLRPGWSEVDLLACGEVVARGRDWLLLRGSGFTAPECRESPGWFLRVLDMAPLAPTPEAPSWAGGRQAPLPLVQEMVDQVDTAFVLGHWRAIAESSGWTTRYSQSQGCFDAADHVQALFDGLGLDAVLQPHRTGYAPNVIGTIPGRTTPDEVAIAIAHLDDLPSSGPAPGADDNASGTAMVTALAEIMSGYCFDRTVKLIAVTGEEQGLYGSGYYAAAAAAADENIVAVLNADMIGWQGDGVPAVENLDLNYNSGSQWLAQAMVDAAADYGTGMTVNAFSCSSMVYSDHAPFWDHGYSAVCGITDNEGFCGHGGNYPFYHQSSDTIANCGPGGPDFEAAAVRTYLATLADIAQPIARIPDRPAGVAASPDGANRIALTWTPQSPGIDFTVYRAAGGCAAPGPPVLVGQTTSAGFVDTTASGGVPYAYTVVATAAGSCSSAASDCVDGATTGACIEPPTFAGAGEVVNAGTSTCRLTVNWQPPQQVWCGGPVAYNVYRGTDPGFTPGAGNRIATQLATTTLNDDDVVHGESYHYVVRAVDLANGNEDANGHVQAGSPTGPAVIGIWSDDAGDGSPAKLIPASPWAVRAGTGVSGASYATGTTTSDLCSALTTPPLLLDASPQLQFWTRYDIESGWDKGELQVSDDGGSSWQRLPMTYPGSSSYSNDACGLGPGTYFTGTAGSYALHGADLSPWAGSEIRLRWLFSSDGSVNYDGWWVDDIAISDVAVPGSCVGMGLLFADGFESGNTGAWSN